MNSDHQFWPSNDCERELQGRKYVIKKASQNSPLICKFCGRKFTQTQTLLSEEVWAHISAHYLANSKATITHNKLLRKCPYCPDGITFDSKKLIDHLDSKHFAQLLTRKNSVYSCATYNTFFTVPQEQLLRTVGHYCLMCRMFVDNSEEAVLNHLNKHRALFEFHDVNMMPKERKQWHEYQYQCAYCPGQQNLRGVKQAAIHAIIYHYKTPNGPINRIRTSNPAVSHDVVQFIWHVVHRIFGANYKRVMSILFPAKKQRTISSVASKKETTTSPPSKPVYVEGKTEQREESLPSIVASSSAQTSANSSQSSELVQDTSISSRTISRRKRCIIIDSRTAIHASKLMAPQPQQQIPLDCNASVVKTEEDSSHEQSQIGPLCNVDDDPPKKSIKIELSEMDLQLVDDKTDVFNVVCQ